MYSVIEYDCQFFTRMNELLYIGLFYLSGTLLLQLGETHKWPQQRMEDDLAEAMRTIVDGTNNEEVSSSTPEPEEHGSSKPGDLKSWFVFFCWYC